MEEFPGIVNQEGEEWKTIPHFENYRCSNYGRIVSLTYGRWGGAGEISQTIDRYGYWRLCLYKNGKQHNFTTHKLVAELFIGPRPENYEIDHKDTNKLNPRFNNLEYVTHSENQKRAFKNNLISGKHFTNEQINEMVLMIQNGFSYRKVAKKFGVGHQRIINILDDLKIENLEFVDSLRG